MNSSSASIATGVMSSQLNGTPVASGVVNRFDRVMMILCGLRAEPLTSRKPFGAGAAGLVDDDERLRHQVVLLDDALDHARHLIGAAAGAGRNDELDRSVGCHAAAAGNASANAPAAATPAAIKDFKFLTLFPPGFRLAQRREPRCRHVPTSATGLLCVEYIVYQGGCNTHDLAIACDEACRCSAQ